MSSGPAPLLPPPGPSPANDGATLLANRYRLDRLLGRGGMGEVWEAWDAELRRAVAIKLLQRRLADHPDFAPRFRRETRIVAQLKHPSIPRLYTTGRAPDGRLYMVMELVAGVTLREYMRAQPEGRLDAASAACIAIQIVEALGVAHAALILHRDVKPENVMVGDEGQTSLLDFGIAHAGPLDLADEAEAGALAKLSGRLGTIGYVSPEQAQGLPVDKRSDYYQLGVTLYEMLSATLPFDVSEEDRTGMLAAHSWGQPVPLHARVPACPDAMCRIVERLLEKDPALRYDRKAELVADLRAIFRESAPPDHPMARTIGQDRRDQELKLAYARRRSRPAESAPPSHEPPDGPLPGSLRPASLPPESLPPERVPAASGELPSVRPAPVGTADRLPGVLGTAGGGGTMPLGPTPARPPAALALGPVEPPVRPTMPLGPADLGKSPAHPAARAAAEAATLAGGARKTLEMGPGDVVASPAHPAARSAAAPATRRSPPRWLAGLCAVLAVEAMLIVAFDVGMRVGPSKASARSAPAAAPFTAAPPAAPAAPPSSSSAAEAAPPAVSATVTAVPTATAVPAATAIAAAPSAAPRAKARASAAPPLAPPAVAEPPPSATPAPEAAPKPRAPGRLFGDDEGPVRR